MTVPDVSDVIGCKRNQSDCYERRMGWALKAAFDDKGLNNRCRLLLKLVNLKLEQLYTVRVCVTSLMTEAQQLCDLGKEMDDVLLAALKLQGLTEGFRSLRLALQNTNIRLTKD